jgi:hypothetical protein
VIDERAASREFADVPGGTTGLLCRDYKGRRADRLVTRIDPGVASQIAELRGHARQAAQELGHWKTGVEEPKSLDASPAAIKPGACHGEPAQAFPANAGAPDGRPRMDGGWGGVGAVRSGAVSEYAVILFLIGYESRWLAGQRALPDAGE